jgi:hypothetical protein
MQGIIPAILALILAALTPLRAQDPTANSNTPAPIVTDRPTFTNSSIVVPSGSFQAENGFLDTDRQGQDIVDGPETLLRFGVGTKTELRFTAPDYYYDLNGSGSGFGDLAVGVKQQLGPTPVGFDVSVTLFLSLPTGAVGVSSGGYDPGLQVAWSHGLSSKWTAAGMFSLYAPTEGPSRDVTGEFTFLIDRLLAPPWDVIVEYVGDFPETRWDAAVAALRNRTEDRQAAATRIRLPLRSGLIVGRSGPFRRSGLFVPLSDGRSQVTRL